MKMIDDAQIEPKARDAQRVVLLPIGGEFMIGMQSAYANLAIRRKWPGIEEMPTKQRQRLDRANSIIAVMMIVMVMVAIIEGSRRPSRLHIDRPIRGEEETKIPRDKTDGFRAAAAMRGE